MKVYIHDGKSSRNSLGSKLSDLLVRKRHNNHEIGANLRPRMPESCRKLTRLTYFRRLFIEQAARGSRKSENPEKGRTRI